MARLLRNQYGMNIVGQGGKIILFMLPALIAAIWVQRYFPRVAALPEFMRFLQPLGYVFLLPGLALWASAVIQLLLEFPKGRLVTSGAYGVVRNPIYASAAFFLLPAAALITFTWGYLVASIFLFAGVIIFIGVEERQLTQTFGKVYEDYLENVDRLIPFRRSGSRPASCDAAGETWLTKVVKAICLGYAIPIVLLLGVVYGLGIHSWMANWGSTAVERQMMLPGDALHPDSPVYTTQAITINAPSRVVWQWLAQIGQDRAGFYSYTWLENLIGSNIHNADTLHPEWQGLDVGDGWRMVPPDYLGGVGKDAVSKVLMLDPGRSLVLEVFGSIVITPLDEHATRLIMRGYAARPDLITTMVWDPIVFTMGKRMLLGLKARAEGRPDASAPWMGIAWLGWVVAAITLAGLFLRQRNRRHWLILPVLVALPAVLASNDFQAGLVAFLATGIPILGFLFIGRSWWGFFLVLSASVLLTLQLVPEAFTFFGTGLALLLLAGLSAIFIRRRSGLPFLSQSSQVAH